MLVNPGRKEWSAAVGLLYSGIQIMDPGESTSAHRHQASALRFVMEGRGAYTVVDGERMTLGARDFVLTPNGTWHDHGVEADGTQCVWQDGLDIPLMNSLDANFYEVHPKIVQKPGKPEVAQGWKKPYTPVFFSTSGTRCLAEAAEEKIVRIPQSVTGGPVMATMGARLERSQRQHQADPAYRRARSTRCRAATAGPRSARSASSGKRRTSSSSRHGRAIATAQRRRPCFSRSMTFRRCAPCAVSRGGALALEDDLPSDDCRERVTSLIDSAGTVSRIGGEHHQVCELPRLDRALDPSSNV
jgi:hypothetical protein